MPYKIAIKFKPLALITDSMGFLIFFPLYLYNRLIKNISRPQNILILKNDYIGDMILATPFLKNLRTFYPEAEITVACRSFSTAVLENNPNVDEVVELNTPWLSRNDAMNYSELWGFIKENFRRYDLVFDLHVEPRNILLAKMVGKNVLSYGFRGLGFLLTKKCKIDWENTPMPEQSLGLLSCIGFEVEKSKAEIFLTKEERQRARKILGEKRKKKVIGIHPGTSDEYRQWPLKKFHSLAKKLNGEYNVVLLDDDKGRANEVKKDLRIRDISGKMNLRDFFSVVEKLDLLIGLESLSVHVAAAVNTPVIDIHSSTTNPGVMGPYTDKKSIIVNDVRCNHCEKRYCPKNEGIKDIEVDEVYEEAVRLLDES